MTVLQYRDRAYDYRLMIATAAALGCCAVGLVAATIVVITGDRFEYRPMSSDLTRSDDNLVMSFQAVESLARKRDGSSTSSPEENRAPDLTSVKSHPALNSESSANECAALSRPYFNSGCLSAERPAKQRSLRLKSPWCNSALSYQPFHSCHPRPRS